MESLAWKNYSGFRESNNLGSLYKMSNTHTHLWVTMRFWRGLNAWAQDDFWQSEHPGRRFLQREQKHNDTTELTLHRFFWVCFFEGLGVGVVYWIVCVSAVFFLMCFDPLLNSLLWGDPISRVHCCLTLHNLFSRINSWKYFADQTSEQKFQDKFNVLVFKGFQDKPTPLLLRNDRNNRIVLRSACLSSRSGPCWISDVCLHVRESLINVSWFYWVLWNMKALALNVLWKGDPTLFPTSAPEHRLNFLTNDWLKGAIVPRGLPQQVRAGTAPLSSSGLLAKLMVLRPELELWFRAAASFCAKSLQEEARETLLTVLWHTPKLLCCILTSNVNVFSGSDLVPQEVIRQYRAKCGKWYYVMGNAKPIL